jgi:hypothetical protein
MNFFYKFDVAKDTKEVSPTPKILKLSYGVITHCMFVIPPGHSAMTGLKLFYHEAQLYPLNRTDWYVGNNTTIEFDEYQPLVAAPYELKAKGYNTSTNHSHAFLIGITVLRPEEMGRKIPVSSLERIRKLIGKEYNYG